MKQKYTLFTLLFASAFASPSILAQSAQDTTYIRKVSLEREYSPTIEDANKIGSSPQIYTPTTTPKVLPLSEWVTSTNGLSPQLNYLPAEAFGTAVAYPLQKGYAGLLFGNYQTLRAYAGIALVQKANTSLQLWGTFDTSEGKSSCKQYVINSLSKQRKWALQTVWKHQFVPFSLAVNAKLQGNKFNYYGAYDLSGSTSPYESVDQSTLLFDVGATIQSRSDRKVKYTASLEYNYLSFDQLMYKRYSLDGVSANTIRANTHFYSDLNTEMELGYRLGVTNQHASADSVNLHTFTHLYTSPYLNMIGGDNWKASIGANLHIVLDESNKLLLTPNISASWNYIPQAELYLNAKGYVSENTYSEIFAINKYVRPSMRILSSRTYLDGKIGTRVGVTKGVELDLFAGYKYTNGEHFFVLDSVNSAHSVLYGDLKTTSIGGAIKTSLIPYTNLLVKAEALSYNVEYHNLSGVNKALGKPNYRIHLQADITPIKNLTLVADYLLEGDRKMLSPLVTLDDMGSINELNLHGNYALTPAITGKLSINNLFSQRNQLYPAYNSLGFNFTLGASIKF